MKNNFKKYQKIFADKNKSSTFVMSKGNKEVKQLNKTIMRTFNEVTGDRGYRMRCSARDNNAEYVITSAYGHDLVNAYKEHYDRLPSARWYHRHFNFE